ncbi:hypothetical protein SLEP1_g54977 [Rubroshorea leprosula]|uniref:F-box domain-containing protein n=1 Tax=Rubroshorea leprosula TaxID=152421 RepID=A0AAV5ME20_9ROSI|nr:hypothetical protein SLEP1_g54977 [Rubroshorea leprosula]
MASFNYLSEELIMEILSWLPADSLVRFKCLSKSWHSPIGHDWFITKQLHNHVRSASDDNLCILLRYRICSDQHDHEEGENVLSLLTYNDKMMLSTSKGGDSPYIVKPVTFSLYKDHQYAESWGSCDGIVFFFDSSYMRDTIVIANPVIGEYRILPESCICLPLSSLYHDDDDDDGDYLARVVDAVGLGYDLKSNDYKILRVWEIESYNDSRLRFPQRAEIENDSVSSALELFSNEKTANRKILDMKQQEEEEDDDDDDSSDEEVEISLFSAVQLASRLEQQDNHYPWKGGELLTLVWLLMNHLGLGTEYYKTLIRWIQSSQKRESASDASEDDYGA